MIYFIGIGGIGISAIARMYLGEGKKVGGSDREPSLVTDELAKLGAQIVFGQKAENIPADCELVIYTNAIGEDNPELVEAKKLGLKIMSYPEALGKISAEKFTIAISGMHGKTTTSAMVAEMLIAAKLDPTVVVGSFLKSGTNFIAGKSNPARLNGRSVGYLVVEADEYKRAFLNLSPKILAINNIDLDHLDYYKDLADIQNAFGELVAKLPADGALVCDLHHPHVVPIIAQAKCPVYDYNQVDIAGLDLAVPGEHNRNNARVAIKIGEVLGIEPAIIIEALNNFKGTWRRFEFKGEMVSGALVYDDYAHNPQKVAAALAGAREKFPDKKIIAVFQPHLFSRTKLLLNDFAKSFADADVVGILDIYPAREAFDPTIHSKDLVEVIKTEGVEAHYLDSFQAAEEFIKTNALSDNDVVMTIGAGDGYKAGEAVIT